MLHKSVENLSQFENNIFQTSKTEYSMDLPFGLLSAEWHVQAGDWPAVNCSESSLSLLAIE